MLRIKRVAIRNWERIREAELVFPAHGLVWVNGPVGSGKTSLGEALSHTLFGITSRYKQVGDYSFKGKGDTYVRLEADLDGKPLLVESGYKAAELSKTGEGLRFVFDNGEPVERDHVRNTRAELTALHGVGDLLAQWTVFLDGDRLKFHRLSQAEAVELVMEALKQPPWAQYHERTRKVLGKLREALALTRQEHGSTRTLLEDAREELREAREDVETEKARVEEARDGTQERIDGLKVQIEGLRSAVVRRQAQAKEIRRSIKKLEETQAQEYADLERRRLSLVSEAATARAEAEPLLEAYSAAKTARQRAEQAYEDATDAPENCPECGQKIPHAHTPAQLKKLKDAVEKAKATEAVRLKKYRAVGERTAQAEEDLRLLERKRRKADAGQEVGELSRDFERLAPANESALVKIAALEAQVADADKVDDSKLVEARAVVTERERLVERVTAKLERDAAEFAEAETRVKVAEYWHRAYGPTGIPNMVLHDTIAPLNAVSGTLSHSLTAGTVDVSYATRRELASGEERSQLIVKVNNRTGAHRVEGASKGESGVIGLTIAETLAEVGRVGRRIGYRWYDETLNTQHLELRNRVLAHVRGLVSRQRMLCFVVDHNPQGIEEVCDYSLVTYKEAGQTVFRWD